MLWFLAAINTFSLTLSVSVVGQTSTPPEMAETYWLTLGSWTQPRKHFSGGVCSLRCERKRFSYSEDKSCCLHYRYHHLDSYSFLVVECNKCCERLWTSSTWRLESRITVGSTWDAGIWCSDKTHYFPGYLLMSTKHKIDGAVYFVDIMGFFSY